MGEEPDTLELSAQERVGRTLCEKWTLERLLGVGGVAAVYAARHRNGRRVAIKVLHSELAVDTRMRKRFLREGYVANKVEHPGAVVVLDDAVAEDGSVFLVMELLSGETLEARCRREGGRIQAADVLIVVHALLEVLQCAHEQGVLHRDVTPSNVFVTQGGGIKLLDFGIAGLRTPDAEPLTKSVAGALGTPGFMSPEQARGLWDEIDPRSDLWAVGAVLYRSLSGRSVHTGRTPSEQLLAAMTKRARSLGEVLEDTPESIVKLVDRALAFEPDKRFPDARSFQRAVAEAYTELTGDPIEKATPLLAPTLLSETTDPPNPTQAAAFGTTVPMPTGQRGPWSRRIAISAAVAVLLGVVALLLIDRNEPAPAPAALVSERPPAVATSAAITKLEATPAVTPSAPAAITSTTPSAQKPRATPIRVERAPRPPRSEDAVLDERQ